MHTEHLQRVRLRLVMTAWLVAVASASLIIFVMLASNVVDMESGGGTRAAISAVAVGFFAGGLFAGLRAGEAPILHGTAIGLFSLLVWFVLNVASTIAFPDFGWQALTPQLTLSIVLIQILAAVGGARLGYRRTVNKR